MLHLSITNNTITNCNSSFASARDLAQIYFFSRLVGDSCKVSTESTVKRLMVFDLLLLLAKYSSKEKSQVADSTERWLGDLLPEIL